MSTKKNILSLVATIFMLIIIVFWIDKSNLFLLFKADVLSMIISIFIAIFIFVITGIKYYFINKQFGVVLKIKDILLFPFVMNLWGTVIPIQGSMIFRTLFFIKKYNMKISRSISTSVYLLIITFCLTGITSFLFVINNKLYFTWLSFVSMVLIINPLLIVIGNFLLKKSTNPTQAVLLKINTFLLSTLDGIIFLLKNIKFTLWLFIISVFHFSLNILWLYFISISLGLDMNIFSIGLIGAIMNISLIFKITPGNLGVVQLASGGVMSLAGYSPDEAVIITLFATAVSMALAFTIGVVGNFYYFKTTHIFKLSNKTNQC